MPTIMRLKYHLAALAAVSWYVSAFLTYVMPTFAAWLPWIGLACCIPAFFISLSALVRRRWREVAAFAVSWVAVTLSFLDVNEPFNWLRRQGFSVHAFPTEQYLSRCRLTEFVEKGVKQTVGSCEA
jgi:hypothetical protein